MVYRLKMVIFYSFLYVYERVVTLARVEDRIQSCCLPTPFLLWLMWMYPMDPVVPSDLGSGTGVEFTIIWRVI